MRLLLSVSGIKIVKRFYVNIGPTHIAIVTSNNLSITMGTFIQKIVG